MKKLGYSINFFKKNQLNWELKSKRNKMIVIIKTIKVQIMIIKQGKNLWY